MKACKTYERDLLFYVYEELEPERIAQVEAHLALCDACRQEVANLRQFDEMVPPEPLIEPSEHVLALLRRSVSAGLRGGAGAQEPPPRGFFSFVQPRPAFQFGFAALLLAFGFLLGREFNRTAPAAAPETLLTDLLSATRQIEASNTKIDPFVTGVERLRFDEATGDVIIEYNTVNDISLKGSLKDQAVREMLKHAMLDASNPGVRLHAVKAVGSMLSAKEGISDDMLDAVTALLKSERTQGVRLHALRILRALPLTDSIKNLLLQVVVFDEDLAMRLEAFRILSDKPLSNQDLAVIERTAQADSLDFIRYQLQKMKKDDTRALGEGAQPVELRRGQTDENPR